MPALLAPQAGQTRRAAQFPGRRVLPPGDVETLLDSCIGLARRPGSGEQGLAPEAMEVGFNRSASHPFDHFQPGGGRRTGHLRDTRDRAAWRGGGPEKRDQLLVELDGTAALISPRRTAMDHDTLYELSLIHI